MWRTERALTNSELSNYIIHPIDEHKCCSQCTKLYSRKPALKNGNTTTEKKNQVTRTSCFNVKQLLPLSEEGATLNQGSTIPAFSKVEQKETQQQ